MNNKPCVQCGYCCTKCACWLGMWDDTKKQCAHLTKDNKCGIYDDIRKTAGSEHSPAFGAGCCMSLFNSVRDEKIRQLKRLHC